MANSISINIPTPPGKRTDKFREDLFVAQQFTGLPAAEVLRRAIAKYADLVIDPTVAAELRRLYRRQRTLTAKREAAK